MLTKTFLKALALSTALTSAHAALAQVPPTASPSEAPVADTTAVQGNDAAIDDVVVTARREAENLQNVPVSVQVVTGASLEKLAITSANEISKLAPGLTLTQGGPNSSVVLRGVTWQNGSGTPATPIYFNEVPFDPATTIQSLFDVGQIEVLRGPQGTSRGAPSISGAVTISTRKPDLAEFGGYVRAQYGSGDHYDVQGAINLPIIKDILAIRLAANVEGSNLDRVYSVNSNIDPKFKDRTYRATVLLQPTDTLSLQAMYQRRKTDRRVYSQVVGTGSPGLAALGIPANFNGPALTVKDRASVQDFPGVNNEHVDLLTVNANWEVFGQNLSYNFGRQFTRSGPFFQAEDPLNILPGFEQMSTVTNASGVPAFRTHEIRISSLTDPDRPFDYDIGWFSKRSSGTINFQNNVYLPGAFGAPFQSRPGDVRTPNQRFVLNASTNIAIGQVFDSFYGNVRFHLDERTELSGGLAILRDRVPVQLDIATSQAAIAYANFLPPASGGCPAPGFLPASPTYGPAYCEVSLAARVVPSQINNDRYSDVIYNFSLSHKFTDDLLVYATTGSSFRTGLPAINNNGLPANLVTPEPETARSYEVGAKASFGRRLRINVAAFQLDYKDQLTAFGGVNYFNTTSNQPAQTSLAFYRGIDSRIRGAEAEIAAQPINNLSLGLNLSYSKIKSKGGVIPVNDPTRPITAANPINFGTSPKGQTLNTTAPFQATANGSYNLPITGAVEGYFRFNANFQGRNPNFGNFKTGADFRSTPSYAIVDLFAGLTANAGGIDIGVYAKNVFDKRVELTRTLTTNTVYQLFAAPSGYDVVRANLPREIGIQARYSFGSR